GPHQGARPRQDDETRPGGTRRGRLGHRHEVKDLRLDVDRGVATLTIDRPEARNALAPRTMNELAQALKAVRATRARVMVIRGTGDRAFCAGGDLKELERMRSAEEAASMARHMRTTLDAITETKIPVIAAINGDAFGGGV